MKGKKQQVVIVKKDYKTVKIETDFPCLGASRDNGKVWKVTSLLQHVKEQELEPFDLPLCGISIGIAVWGEAPMDVLNFTRHWKRAMETDLKYPVILDETGWIMDGWHRVAKALYLGHSTIKAVRFDKTPDCDYIVAE